MSASVGVNDGTQARILRVPVLGYHTLARVLQNLSGLGQFSPRSQVTVRLHPFRYTRFKASLMRLQMVTFTSSFKNIAFNVVVLVTFAISFLIFLFF